MGRGNKEGRSVEVKIQRCNIRALEEDANHMGMT